jgi:hypothetical protein
MKRINFLFPVFLSFLSCATFAGESQNNGNGIWSLTSPDRQCEISVSLASDGTLYYQTSRAGKLVIQKSQIGLRRNDESFEHGLVFKSAGKIQTRREKYELFAGVQPRINHLLNYRSLVFCNTSKAPIQIDLAASDEGVAFRYRFAETNDSTHIVESEMTSFALPLNARGWLQPYQMPGPYAPACEDYYFHVSPGDPPPGLGVTSAGWAFPALFNVSDANTWVLLTESGTDGSYCACHLNPDSSGGIYRIAFPLAAETTRGYTNKFGPEPRFSLPWTMPWRVIVMGKSAGDIAMETLVTDLAPPSRITDTSWIKPGRASWAWWSYPNGPDTTNLFDEFSDFAAKMGWEYTLFDDGWWNVGLKPIANYAHAKGVVPLAWLNAKEFYDAKSRDARLDELSAAKVGGLKVDFWNSERQETMAAQQALMKDAAVHHLVVNIHGCTIPRGWNRTWPNFLTCEALLGGETYFHKSNYPEKAAELDAALPFTRNAVGPMDFTPVACSPKKYARLTTAAHQLASALIFTSGIIHYADSPEFFESLPPQVLEIFRDAPARWDETRCLAGDPGTIVVFARRTGKSWFIAGINGTDKPLPINLDLSRFKKFHHRFEVSEGENANMQVAVTPLKSSNEWQHEMPPRGGFILRLN